MREFAALYGAIDETNRTSEKVAALVDYFRRAPAEDAAWAVHFLIGRRPKRLIGSVKLQRWAAEVAGIPEWLFAECYDAVGDLAETIASVLPDREGPRGEDRGLAYWVTERLLPLGGLEEEAQRASMVAAWEELDRGERFVFGKLITGSFRVGVSQDLVVRALAQKCGVDSAVIAHRLMGDWTPNAESFARITGEDTGDSDHSRPYPFCLAHPLEGGPEALGDVTGWHLEWKWDGIRAQVIRRGGDVFVWSRGEELITDRFPEMRRLAEALPEGTVLDGELMAWQGEAPLKFAELQKRIGRKVLTKKVLDSVPAVLVAFDLLEVAGVDIRDRPLAERRERLEALLQGLPEGLPVRLSQEVVADDWDGVAAQRAAARERGVEGLMLKGRETPYGVGRKRGAWWKWKVDPLTVDAVLVYAQRGSGRRASLYTDYTFALWHDGKLVPFAKAYSGLSDEEIRKVDAYVRRNTLEKFGPVRTVTAELVMELAFEGIQLSSRHKSGIAVRFPRIARWRHDKTADQADTLEGVRALLQENAEAPEV